MGEPEKALRDADEPAPHAARAPQTLDSAVTVLTLIATTNAAALVNAYWAQHGPRQPGPDAGDTEYALNTSAAPGDDGGQFEDEEKLAATARALAICAMSVARIWARPTQIWAQATPGPRIDARDLFERLVETVHDLDPLQSYLVDLDEMGALPDAGKMADLLAVPPYLRETVTRREALRDASRIIFDGASKGATDLEGLSRALNLITGHEPLVPGDEA